MVGEGDVGKPKGAVLSLVLEKWGVWVFGVYTLLTVGVVGMAIAIVGGVSVWEHNVVAQRVFLGGFLIWICVNFFASWVEYEGEEGFDRREGGGGNDAR